MPIACNLIFVPTEEYVRVGEICALRSGVTIRARSDTRSTGLLTIQVVDVAADGSFDATSATRMPVPAWSSRHVVAPGEVVFRSRGPLWAAWAADDVGEPLVAVAPLFILHPDPHRVDARYLAWWFGRPLAQQHFASASMGTSVKMITKSALEQTPISLPPLDEQRWIAGAAALIQRERALTRDLSRLRADFLSARLDRAATSPTDKDTTHE